VTLDDDSIFNDPFVFMSDVGTLGLSDSQAERMRPVSSSRRDSLCR